VWLLQDGEPLPIDDQPRLMRTGDQARRLAGTGYDVTWWTSRFNHGLKRFRDHDATWQALGPRYRIALLDGPGYARNLSVWRIRHHRAIAAHFIRLSARLPPPALILGSYPSPELCEAGGRYANRHNVPFVVDIRDPWPDIFPDYLPVPFRCGLLPMVWYYRRKMRAIARHANSLVAVSDAMLDWGLRYAGRRRTARDRVFHIGFTRHLDDRQITVPAAFTPDDPLVCLFATTCGQSYNGEMLIEAARALESAGERRIRFVVSGDGELRGHWMALARGLASVHFTGWIAHDALQAHFRQAHLGLVLLKGGIIRFWLGNKLFEYLSAGLGIVNDVGGEAATLVGRRGLGVNVESQNPSSLAAALRALVTDPQRVRQHMQNAHVAFRRDFDRETVESDYVHHLAELMRPHAPAHDGALA